MGEQGFVVGYPDYPEREALLVRARDHVEKLVMAQAIHLVQYEEDRFLVVLCELHDPVEYLVRGEAPPWQRQAHLLYYAVVDRHLGRVLPAVHIDRKDARGMLRELLQEVPQARRLAAARRAMDEEVVRGPSAQERFYGIRDRLELPLAVEKLVGDVIREERGFIHYDAALPVVPIEIVCHANPNLARNGLAGKDYIWCGNPGIPRKRMPGFQCLGPGKPSVWRTGPQKP